MINFDEYTDKNKIEHNSNYPYIPDHPYRILIIGGSGSGKTNALLNLINNQPDINKYICMLKIHAKLLLSILIICMMFPKILTIIILIKKLKY